MWLGLNGRLLCGRRTLVASDRGHGEWHWIPWSSSISASSQRVLRNSLLWNLSPHNNAKSTTFVFMTTRAVGVFLQLYPGLHMNFSSSSGHARVGLFFIDDCYWCQSVVGALGTRWTSVWSRERCLPLRNEGVAVSHPSANKHKKWWKHVFE